MLWKFEFHNGRCTTDYRHRPYITVHDATKTVCCRVRETPILRLIKLRYTRRYVIFYVVHLTTPNATQTLWIFWRHQVKDLECFPFTLVSQKPTWCTSSLSPFGSRGFKPRLDLLSSFRYIRLVTLSSEYLYV